MPRISASSTRAMKRPCAYRWQRPSARGITEPDAALRPPIAEPVVDADPEHVRAEAIVIAVQRRAGELRSGVRSVAEAHMEEFRLERPGTIQSPFRAAAGHPTAGCIILAPAQRGRGAGRTRGKVVQGGFLRSERGYEARRDVRHPQNAGITDSRSDDGELARGQPAGCTIGARRECCAGISHRLAAISAAPYVQIGFEAPNQPLILEVVADLHAADEAAAGAVANVERRAARAPAVAGIGRRLSQVRSHVTSVPWSIALRGRRTRHRGQREGE